MTADISLSAQEQELFRDSLRKFLAKEVEPHYAQWEKDEIFPRELWNKLGENGYLCVDVPEQYGGYGADFKLSSIIIEEIAAANYGALASSVSVHSDIVTPYISHLGSEDQKQKWLPKLVTGEAVGAIGMTEPGAGSDLQGMRTSAKSQGSDYVINGQKTFITNGQHCDLLIVATKTDPMRALRASPYSPWIVLPRVFKGAAIWRRWGFIPVIRPNCFSTMWYCPNQRYWAAWVWAL